jgi:hypothetical protein
MPTIHNVRLEIAENQGAAAALVTYRVAFNSQDLGEPLKFFETVELIGVDAGEDGQNDPIPGGRSFAKVTLSINAPERRRLIALQGTSLDEDKDAAGPLSTAALVRPDEIRAHVTLTSQSGRSVSAGSEPLLLHQQTSGNNSPSPA